MWTSSVKAVAQDPTVGVAVVVITYTNGVTPLDITYRVSEPASLRQIASDQINELTRIDAVAALIATPPLGAIDLSVPALTQAQIDQAQFIKDYTSWVNVKTKLIDTGILTGTETAVVNLKAKVQSEFKPAYLAGI